MDNKKKSLILRGIGLNFGEVENLNDLEPLEVPDSTKILIKDIIKNYSIESLLFSHNLELNNYIDIFDGRGNRKFPKALQLKYERELVEPVHNLFNSFVVGNNFSTNPENKYYGIQMRYYPIKGGNINRFSISLEFNSYMDLHLTKINKMGKLLSKKIKKKRSKIEIIGNNTKKSDFFPYFRKGDVKGMVLFKNAKNLDFIRSFNGYFNINDLRGNRILTKCKLDIPFCNVHIPQKGKIYGRDKYLVAKFNPFKGIFNILEKDGKVEKFTEQKFKSSKVSSTGQVAKESTGQAARGYDNEMEQIVKKGVARRSANINRASRNRNNSNLNSDGERIGPNGERVGPNGESAGPNGERIGPNGERAGPNGESAGPNGESAGPNGGRIGENGERIEPNGEIIGENGEIVGLQGGEQGLEISYFNYDPTPANTTKEKGSFIEKQIHNEEINFDWFWYEDDPENEIIIGDKKDNVYLLIEGFIKSPKNGNVVFQVSSDDGVRIDIAGETQLKNEEGIVTDTWKGQPMTPYTTNSISMKKDKFYKLKIEYYEGGSAGGLKLEWKWRVNQSFQVVPANVFFRSGQNSEGFIGNFQGEDTESDPEDIPIKKDNYIKYFSMKECMLEKDKNEKRIKNNQFAPHEKITEIAKQEHLKPFQDLVGPHCIKHTRDSRDDFFFGGFDKDNNMFCYKEDSECFMFKDQAECEKMGLEELMSLPPPNQIKGIDYDGERNYYDPETIKTLQTELAAELEENGNNLVLKCPEGQYLEGTFNPDDSSYITGGIFKDCSDPKHPDHETCAPGPSHHLAELITNKGNKIYDTSKPGKDSNFGNLMGKCMPMNVPGGKMEECDPLDDFQPCYVGERPTEAPGVSKPNTDLYKKLFGFNCTTRTIDTTTCKHNNNGILSDVITFRDPVEKDYEQILNKQTILQAGDAYDLNFSTDEEKYLAENLHFYIEKYEQEYEDMNPNKYFQKPRYTLDLEEYYDLTKKEDVTKLVVKYKGKKETILSENSSGEVYNIKQNDVIEILLHKDNHLLFQIINPITKEIIANHRSDKPIEGKYGSPVNFFISGNNNTFIRDIKYKEFVPKTVLPYNPFMDIKQV